MEIGSCLSKNLNTRIFLMVYAFLYGIALNISGRAEPQYIYSYLKDTFSNVTHACGQNEDNIQKEASLWSWYLSVTEYGSAIPVVIIFGPIADRFGRKPVLIWNGFLTFLSFVLRTLVVYRQWSLDVLLAARLISGLSGSFYTFDLANHAIMANITSNNNSRSFLMVVFDSFLGISVTVASVLTGYLIKWSGYTYPFLATSGVLLFYVLVVIVTLQDPLRDNSTSSQRKSCTEKINFVSLFQTSSMRFVNLNQFILFYVIYMFYYLAFNSFVALRTLYQLGPPFCWSSVHIGWYGAAEDVELFIVASVLMTILQTKLDDKMITFMALISAAGCYGLFGASSNNLMIYGATATGILRILCIPLLKGIMSTMVNPDKQGVLFSCISLIEVVSAVAGSSVFNNIYQETRPVYRGLVFFVMAGYQLVASLFILYNKHRYPESPKEEILIVDKNVQTYGTIAE